MIGYFIKYQKVDTVYSTTLFIQPPQLLKHAKQNTPHIRQGGQAGRQSERFYGLTLPSMGFIMPGMGNPNPIQPALSGLADALFSTTRQKVLAFIFGQPDRSFYASELITLANSGSGAVQRELARLAQSGLATMTRIGNQIHYQANADSPIYDDLCNIVDKTVGLVGPIQHALTPLAQYISLAFVYGSVAKRRDHAGSDVDLMIISDTLNYSDIYPALEPVTVRIRRTVNPHLCSQQEFRQLLQNNNAFITRVMEQPKLWILGDENDIPAG